MQLTWLSTCAPCATYGSRCSAPRARVQQAQWCSAVLRCGAVSVWPPSPCAELGPAAHHFFMLASSSGVAFGHLLAQSSSVVLQEIGPLRTRKPPPPPLQSLRESGTSLGRPCAGNWRAEAHETSTIANGAARIVSRTSAIDEGC